MKEEFTKKEIEQINKALVRSEEDIKNGRVSSYEDLWERMDNIIAKNSKLQRDN